MFCTWGKNQSQLQCHWIKHIIILRGALSACLQWLGGPVETPEPHDEDLLQENQVCLPGKTLHRHGNWFGGGTINSRQTGEHVLCLLPLQLGCKLTGAGQTSLFHIPESCATTSPWAQLLAKHWDTTSYTHCPSLILCISTLASNANRGSSWEPCPSPEQVLITTFVHHQGIYSCCTLQEIKREHQWLCKLAMQTVVCILLSAKQDASNQNMIFLCTYHRNPTLTSEIAIT